ncbi:hypothetical protein QT995_26170 [Microcoleus sp. S36b_A3]|uniref:hypothetical protein n=1 Tax=unclassified Microcoleus TaxID=2642155 RepID=UPI002FD64A67
MVGEKVRSIQPSLYLSQKSLWAIAVNFAPHPPNFRVWRIAFSCTGDRPYG